MLCIKLDSNMELMITKNEPIYRGDNLSQKIAFYIPVKIREVDIVTASVFMSYVRPDGTPDILTLNRGEEPYNENYYEFTLPVDQTMTKFPGVMQLWLQIYSGNASSPVIAKSGECAIQILESKDMDDYLGDQNVRAIYQLKKEMDDSFEDVHKSIETITATKADNVVYDAEAKTLQLIANGEPIGDTITVQNTSTTNITDMKISVDGELIVTFDNGDIQNLGVVVGDDGAIYVPHIDAHNVLTFTIEKEPGEIPPPVDLVHYDDWGNIDEDGNWGDIDKGEQVESTYVWDTL